MRIWLHLLMRPWLHSSILWLVIALILALFAFWSVPPVHSGTLPFYSMTTTKSVYEPYEKIKILVVFFDGAPPASSVDIAVPGNYHYEGITRQDGAIGNSGITRQVTGKILVTKIANGIRFSFVNPGPEAKYFEFSGYIPTCSKRVLFQVLNKGNTASLTQLPMFVLVPGPAPCLEYHLMFPIVRAP